MDVKDLIRKHEGLRLLPYLCTSGKITIGYGRNLEDVGITPQEAEIMLVTDLNRCLTDLNRLFPDFLGYPQEVKAVLTDLLFNLGTSRFLTFKKFIEAIRQKDYQRACEEMKDSKWYSQVTNRAEEDIRILRSVISNQVG